MVEKNEDYVKRISQPEINLISMLIIVWKDILVQM